MEDLRIYGLIWDNRGDRVDWRGSYKEGMITVDSIYNGLIMKSDRFNTTGQFKGIWENTAPLKMKNFLSLVLRNKNLTWQNL